MRDMNKEDIMKPASLAWALPLTLTLIWLLGLDPVARRPLALAP